MGLATIGGAAGGGAPPVADTTLKRLSLTPDALTGSSALSSLSITQTLNTSGAPTIIDVAVTNTASGAGTLLANFRVGGSSKSKLDIEGYWTASGFIGRGVSIDVWALGNVTLPGASGKIDFSDNKAKITSPEDHTVQIGNNHASVGTIQTLKSHNVTAGRGAGLDLLGGASGDASGYGSVRLMAGTVAGVEVAELSGAARIGFFGVSPAAQPNTGVSGAGSSAGSGTAVTEDSTFGGYTVAQIVAALQSVGLLN